MVLCFSNAKPSPSCACMFTALTVASATASVSMMSLIQAGLAAHGHVWALDWAVDYTDPPHRVPARMASAVSSQWDASNLEFRNASKELSSQLDSIRTELLHEQERQHSEVMDAIANLGRSLHRDALQWRKEFLNFTQQQRREVSDVLLEQLKTLEDIKLRGSDREPQKKTSAIGEGLWGLLSSTVGHDREDDSTTGLVSTSRVEVTTTRVVTSTTSSTTSHRGFRRQAPGASTTQRGLRENTLGTSRSQRLGTSGTQRHLLTTTPSSTTDPFSSDNEPNSKVAYVNESVTQPVELSDNEI